MVEFDSYFVGNTNNDADTKVSPHFRLREFACKDGSPMVFVNNTLVSVLENIRELAHEPIYINSGYRTPAHNTAVHGAANSRHQWGQAADIRAAKATPEQLYSMAEKAFEQMGFDGGGLIWYPHFIHVDVREEKYRAPKESEE